MKIEHRDILTVTTGIIGHQVNCQRVMGGGLALQIRNKWPHVYRAYVITSPRLGHLELVYVGPDLYVANLYGQDRYGHGQRYTDYPALQEALGSLHASARALGLPVYLPYGLGCGLAGGDWRVVEPLIAGVIPDAVLCKL